MKLPINHVDGEWNMRSSNFMTVILGVFIASVVVVNDASASTVSVSPSPQVSISIASPRVVAGSNEQVRVNVYRVDRGHDIPRIAVVSVKDSRGFQAGNQYKVSLLAKSGQRRTGTAVISVPKIVGRYVIQACVSSNARLVRSRCSTARKLVAVSAVNPPSSGSPIVQVDGNANSSFPIVFPDPATTVTFHDEIMGLDSAFERVSHSCPATSGISIDVARDTFTWHGNSSVAFQISSTGQLTPTGRHLDIALSNDDTYIRVVDPSTGAVSFQRFGALNLNDQGVVVAADGSEVSAAGIGVDANPDTSSLSQLKLPIGYMDRQDAARWAFSISRGGQVVYWDDATNQLATAGWIVLARFEHPEALTTLGNGRWLANAAAGSISIGVGGEGEFASSWIQYGALEVPRIEKTDAFADALTQAC